MSSESVTSKKVNEEELEKNTLLGNPCLGIKVPNETAIDIDNHLDLQLARILFNSRHN